MSVQKEALENQIMEAYALFDRLERVGRAGKAAARATAQRISGPRPGPAAPALPRPDRKAA